MKYQQEQIGNRQQIMIEKGFTPIQVAGAYRIALQSVAPEKNLDDLDDEEIEALNQLAGSFLQLQQPIAGKKKSGFMGLGSSPTVTPGPQVNPRNNAQPANPQPNKTNNQQAKPQPTRLQLDDATKKAMTPGTWYPAKGSKGTVIYIMKQAD